MSRNLHKTQNLLELAIDRHFLSVSANTLVMEAIGLMSQARVSYILIVDQDKLLGIFTERDVVKLTAAAKDLSNIPISEVMTKNIISLKLSPADNIYSVLELLRSSRIRHLPIINNTEKILGVITPESIRQVLKPTDLLQMGRIEQIMITSVITAPLNASIWEIAQQMTNNRKSCIVICTELTKKTGENPEKKYLKPVGIITERDLVKLTANQNNIREIVAEQVMVFPLVSIQENDTLWTAHQIMEKHKIRRLVVVDQQGYLVGLVTQSNLIHALDPVEMNITVELLHQTIAEKTRILQQVNEEMQQEVTQRQQIEEKLREATENLEETVKQRTLELIQSNKKLKQEIQARIAAETEIRRLNAELELRVQERTAQLEKSNEELQQEISDRQLLEDKLRISENKMRVVFEAMTDIVMLIDKDKNIQILPTNINEFYQPGYDIINLTLDQFFQEESSECWQQVCQVLETQNQRDFDYKLCINNQEFWFTTCISPMSEDTVIWVARNISDRQQSQQTLQQKNQELATTLEQLKMTQEELIQSEKMAALGQLIAGIAHEINTPLGAIRSSVQNIADFLADNLEKLPEFFQTLSPANQQYFWAIIHSAKQEITDTLSSKEKRQIRKKLQRQLEEWQIEKADSIACTLVDIGIWDNLEKFLPLLQDAKGQEILQTSYEVSTLNKSTKTITIATDRAAKIVFALKNYARFDPSGEKIMANIIEGIETILTLYQNQLKHGIEVIRNYQNNLPALLCYPDELNQVWTNLIHNAIQAMDNKGILKIDVQHESDHLLVKITDNGPGIPSEIIRKIFNPFFTTKPAGQGSGLGLNIVKKIIDKHEGTIEVESIPGKTTFLVILPL